MKLTLPILVILISYVSQSEQSSSTKPKLWILLPRADQDRLIVESMPHPTKKCFLRVSETTNGKTKPDHTSTSAIHLESRNQGIQAGVHPKKEPRKCFVPQMTESNL